MGAGLRDLVCRPVGAAKVLGAAYPGLRRLTATWPGLAQVGPLGLPSDRNKNGPP